MIKRVIFFVESPFYQRDYDRFGIEILLKNGFEVEVWNFAPFLNPQVRIEIEIPDPINWEKHYSYINMGEAKSAILKLEDSCIVVCLVNYHIKSFPIYKALSKNNIQYCVVMAHALPLLNAKKKLRDYFKSINRTSPVKIANLLFTCVPYKYLGIKPTNIILAGGTESIKYKYPIDKNTEILWLHTFDYDSYTERRDSPVQCDNNMGVFLDEYLPFHPDFVQLGLSVPSTPEEYYPGICKFFDYIEQAYGVHIVIAAHPKSNYETYPYYFGGRPIIKGKTAELVRKSGFTIAHMSTSINFAILFHKPVIFITSNRLKQSFIGSQINLMASWLGKKAINIDNPIKIDWEEECSINEKAYMNYMQSYIKREGSEELPFWQIFANRIKKIL